LLEVIYSEMLSIKQELVGKDALNTESSYEGVLLKVNEFDQTQN